MVKIFFLFFILSTSNVWAEPERLEVWFLTARLKNTSQLDFDFKNAYQYAFDSRLHKSCQEMGEAYFHPQFGIHLQGHEILEKKKNKVIKKERESSYFSDIDTDLIKCDKGTYFDIYCGKASQENKKNSSTFEMWIDTSSSLRGVDYSSHKGGCYRRSFITRVYNHCQGRPLVYGYDTAIKQLGSLEDLCQTRGLNDEARLMKWISSSSARNILIITDISEFTSKFADYLNSKEAILRGHLPNEPLYADTLNTKITHAQKLCK